MINVELLKKVQEKILAHPEEFDMGLWGWEGCGTAMCISGWAWKIKNPDRDMEFMQSHESEQLLGINSKQANRLFYTDCWPPQFEARFKHPEDEHKDFPYSAEGNAKVAAERIQHFIDTNGEE